jgi:peptidoglycan/LPS O-acetylase OafA/YrhL
MLSFSMISEVRMIGQMIRACGADDVAHPRPANARKTTFSDGWWHCRSARRRGPLLIEGLAGIAAGIITFAWPEVMGFQLVYLIAGWVLVTGILEIAAAIRLRKYVPNEWLLVLSGVASLILGMGMVSIPLAGVLTIALWVGVYAVILGALLVALGIRLRSGRAPSPPTHRRSTRKEMRSRRVAQELHWLRRRKQDSAVLGRSAE